MLRSISSRARRAGPAIVAVVIMAAAVPALAVSDGERAAIDRGRAAGRALLLARDPREIGIALLHARAQADVEALLAAPGIAPQSAEGLRAFAIVGERDGFDNGLRGVQAMSPTSAAWDAKAREAALYDAGIASSVVVATGGTPAQEQLIVNVADDVAAHAARLHDGVLGVPAASARSSALRFAHEVAAAAETIAPQAPFAVLPFRDGPHGDAALGVAGATVAELIDSPYWLMQADAQRFIDAYAARLSAVAPASQLQVSALRERLRGGPTFARGPTAHDAALQANTALIASIVRGDAARAKPMVLGSVAAQLTYNAAILRDPAQSAQWLRLIAQSPDLDAGVPGWVRARSAADGMLPTEWHSQFARGLRLVDLIANGGGTP